MKIVGALPVTAVTWDCRHRDLVHPCFGNFPPTPRLPLSGLAAPPVPRDMEKKDD